MDAYRESSYADEPWDENGEPYPNKEDKLDEPVGSTSNWTAAGGCFVVILGLIVATVILSLVFGLAYTVGSPLSAWRSSVYAAADPAAPALVIMSFGSAALLVLAGLVLGFIWRFWLFQALTASRPRRLTLGSYGRWCAVIGLTGAGIAALIVLTRDRVNPVPMTRFQAVDVAVGFVIILPLLLWALGASFRFFGQRESVDDWDGLEALPRSIARQLARNGLVPQRIFGGVVLPPEKLASTQGDKRVRWRGSGWLVGEDCLVDFTFEKSTKRDSADPPSALWGWQVTGQRIDFREAAQRGSRIVPVAGDWGSAAVNDHPWDVSDPLEAIPYAALAKVSGASGFGEFRYALRPIGDRGRYGYRFIARSDEPNEVVVVVAERTVASWLTPASKMERLNAQILTVPWSVSFARARTVEAARV